MNKIVFIFPAFGIDFLGFENNILQEYSMDINSYFIKASKILNTGLKQVNSKEDLPNDELTNQYLIFIYSVMFSDLFKKRNIIPDLSAGYSMGIYAALYNAGSINWTDGLLLIKNAFNISNEILITDNKKYSMGFTIGLEKNDVIKIIISNKKQVEIINQNNKYNMIIAGIYDDVNFILNECLKEGALKVKFLNAKIPYHSKFMKKASLVFKDYLNSIKIENSKIDIISSYNNKIINKRGDIIDELVNNVGSNINWQNTFETMLSKGYNNFIECGPGDSLNKIAKFIDGNFKVISINKINNIIKT